MKAQMVGAGGMAGVFAALSYLGSLLADPSFLVDLYVAVKYHHDDNHAIAKIAAALFGVLFAAFVAYLGDRPTKNPTLPAPGPEEKPACLPSI